MTDNQNELLRFPKLAKKIENSYFYEYFHLLLDVHTKVILYSASDLMFYLCLIILHISNTNHNFLYSFLFARGKKICSGKYCFKSEAKLMF